mmetsp:Transcript_73515/g.191888  ORF Transcript_73515/g.191888 Transcript_73515/m.191888 type:complete len:439 (-) Transcript_73515:53-1369(-)
MIRMMSGLFLYLGVEVHGLHLVRPSIANAVGGEGTMPSCREYAMNILAADWEYNEHELAELLPEQGKWAKESATSFARKQVDDWDSQGLDYCPFSSVTDRRVGAEAMKSRISQGHWTFVPERELDEWFSDSEIKALHGEVTGGCLPDGTGRRWPRSVGRESMHLAWSSCSKQSGGCKTMRDVVHWMTTRGLTRLLLVGDSMMEQFWGAAQCSLEKEDCTAVEAPPGHKRVSCPSRSGTGRAFEEIDFIMLPMHRVEQVLDNVTAELDRADIAIVNQGHHGPDHMDAVMKLMVEKAKKNVGTQRKVFWSQSTQPHFPGEDGSFKERVAPNDVDFNQVDPSLMLCGPFKNDSRQFSANADAEALLKQIDDKSNVRVLPFHQFSAGRWDMHGNWGGRRDEAGTKVDVDARRLHWQNDCLHFVYSPTFYAPYFGLLNEALER